MKEKLTEKKKQKEEQINIKHKKMNKKCELERYDFINDYKT